MPRSRAERPCLRRVRIGSAKIFIREAEPVKSLESLARPKRFRTPDPQIRSLVLYPAELRARAHRKRFEEPPCRRFWASRQDVNAVVLPRSHNVAVLSHRECQSGRRRATGALEPTPYRPYKSPLPTQKQSSVRCSAVSPARWPCERRGRRRPRLSATTARTSLPANRSMRRESSPELSKRRG